MGRLGSFLVLVGALSILAPSRALAQTYEVSVEESGALPTAYTKRFNWRYYLTVYRHTTMVAKDGSPTLCSESACLDDNLPGGGLGPDGTRGGTAKAIVPGMTPGKYRLELRYNQTVNRTTSVPWKISTDAATNNSRSGNLDQKNTAPDTGNWLVLGQSDQNPIHVQSSTTFVFGSDTINFNGSLSYGGIRLVRVGNLPTVTDAGIDGSAGDASIDSSVDSGWDADVADEAASDSGVGGGAGGSGAPNDAAASGGSGGVAGSQSGVVPLDEGGCSCSFAKSESTGGAAPHLLAVLAVLLGLTRRAVSPAQQSHRPTC